MPKLFISYRRADSRKDAGRLYDRMVESFGKDNIFKDVDTIPPGSDFRGVISEAVNACDVLLAVIGQGWLSITDERGARRLDNPADFVRLEIQTALQRDRCLVIPVLVDNAAMPAADDLPLELRELAFKNAVIVRDDPDFHPDVSRLIRGLESHFGTVTPPKPPAPTLNINDSITRFFEAFEAHDWETARSLLAEIRASGRAPRIFDVDAHEKEVWAAMEAEERDREYDLLRLMARRPNPTLIWAALQKFWEAYPGHDPDNLARFEQVIPFVPSAPAVIKRRTVLDLLPAPFEWIQIPAGQVTLITEKGWNKNYIPEGQSQTFTLAQFAIAKYPLTNAQYRLFVEGGGYNEPKWWTGSGWAQRETYTWTQPRDWADAKWNGAEQPVVGVSWYEAVAYCNWLSAETGESIRLPSEQEWQRAAQGDDGRDYPWGKQWDASRCNNNVDGKGIGKTTPVRQYEGMGDSPFMVVEIAGNVSEWCATAYKSGSNDLNGTDVRFLRGGSWSSTRAAAFRCDFRNGYVPSDSFKGWGLRLALS